MRYKNIDEAKLLAPQIPAIYAIASYPDVYIGATSCLKQRMIEHSSQLKKRPGKQKKLSAMIGKHGQDKCKVFVLLLDSEKSMSAKHLHENEAAIMQLFSNLNYNVVSSAASLNTGEKNNFYGKQHTKAVKEKSSRKVRIENDMCGVEFDSGTAAAKAFDISRALVVKRCKNNMVVDGAKWSYTHDAILSITAA